MARRWWRQTRWFVLRTLVRIRRRVPPGLRLPLGLLLMVGGVFGMLPVLGFWMLPWALGVAVAALDVRPLVDAIPRTHAEGPGQGRAHAACLTVRAAGPYLPPSREESR